MEDGKGGFKPNTMGGFSSPACNAAARRLQTLKAKKAAKTYNAAPPTVSTHESDIIASGSPTGSESVRLTVTPDY